MSSPTQIAANRTNALRSTGPRTHRGKATSSSNALTHGAYASDDTLLAISSARCLSPSRPGCREHPVLPLGRRAS
jgi:hypothetical protein